MFFLKRIIKLFLSLIVSVADSLKALLLRAGNNIGVGVNVVLYYHSVTSVELPRFIWQMELLKKNKLLIDSNFEEIPHQTSGCAIVTFDDGFTKTIDLILPTMERLSIPFTVFVPAGLMGMTQTWISNKYDKDSSEIVVNEDKLRELALHPLITIGSHGLNHQSMLSLDEKDSVKEIVESKRKLENITQSNVEVISWPHGEYDSFHVEITRKAGYKRSFGIKPTNFTTSDGNVIGRCLANPSDWPLEFRLKVKGCYRSELFLSRVKKFLLNPWQWKEAVDLE